MEAGVMKGRGGMRKRRGERDPTPAGADQSVVVAAELQLLRRRPGRARACPGGAGQGAIGRAAGTRFIFWTMNR
jgi:hypothetical protein